MSFPLLTRGISIRTRARTHKSKESRNTRTQQKQQQHNAYWQQQQQQQQQTGPIAVAAARRRGGGVAARQPATSERTSYRPFDDSVPWWLSFDVRERTRRVYTRSKRHYKLSHMPGATTVTAQPLLAAAAADRPKSSNSSSQWGRRRGIGGGQLQASEPPTVRLTVPCLGGCTLTYASERGVRTHEVNESINTRT